MANKIDMNAQSDLMADFEEGLWDKKQQKDWKGLTTCKDLDTRHLPTSLSPLVSVKAGYKIRDEGHMQVFYGSVLPTVRWICAAGVGREC